MPCNCGAICGTTWATPVHGRWSHAGWHTSGTYVHRRHPTSRTPSTEANHRRLHHLPRHRNGCQHGKRPGCLYVRQRHWMSRSANKWNDSVTPHRRCRRLIRWSKNLFAWCGSAQTPILMTGSHEVRQRRFLNCKLSPLVYGATKVPLSPRSPCLIVTARWKVKSIGSSSSSAIYYRAALTSICYAARPSRLAPELSPKVRETLFLFVNVGIEVCFGSDLHLCRCHEAGGRHYSGLSYLPVLGHVYLWPADRYSALRPLRPRTLLLADLVGGLISVLVILI